MRKLLPIGIVLLAGVVGVAHEPPAPTSPSGKLSWYRFDGQLGYRTGDGTFLPLLPDAVFLGWGDTGCRPADQFSERLIVYPDGIFQLSISPLVTTASSWIATTPFDSALFVPVPGRLVEWPCYRFRVAGCDDAVVPFGPTPPKSRIELNCPSRETTPRRDG